MNSFADLASDFQPDGSLRDIYVLGTNDPAWRKFLSELKTSAFRFEVRGFFGEMAALPNSYHEAVDDEGRRFLLKIKLPGATLNCHFFTIAEVELDLDPAEISQTTFNEVVGFMRWLSLVVTRDVILTHENQPDRIILRVSSKL